MPRPAAQGPTFWDTLPLLPTLRSISTRHCDMAGADLSQGVLAVTSLQALELSSYLVRAGLGLLWVGGCALINGQLRMGLGFPNL